MSEFESFHYFPIFTPFSVFNCRHKHRRRVFIRNFIRRRIYRRFGIFTCRYIHIIPQIYHSVHFPFDRNAVIAIDVFTMGIASAFLPLGLVFGTSLGGREITTPGVTPLIFIICRHCAHILSYYSNSNIRIISIHKRTASANSITHTTRKMLKQYFFCLKMKMTKNVTTLLM